jgi:hypothetical protein
VPGPSNPLQVTEQFALLRAFCCQAIQDRLNQIPVDFLFVSDQTNPLALTLETEDVNTRLILIIHERPAERLRQAASARRGLFRLALEWEAQRAERFETENLACYDGVIVANEHDRDSYVLDYGFPSDRVAVIGKGLEVASQLARLDNWLGELANQSRLRGRATPLPVYAPSSLGGPPRSYKPAA